MKIGKIQVHLKARSHARLNHVSALLPLAIISLTPIAHSRTAAMFVKESWLSPPIGRRSQRSLCYQTEDQRSHPNGKVPCPISEWGQTRGP
jgi:hypothetical protein